MEEGVREGDFRDAEFRKPEFDDFNSKMSKLSEDERTELKEYLSSRHKRDYKLDLNELTPGALRDSAAFFIPLPLPEERKIWAAQKKRRVEDLNAYLVPEDERVEDAGLTDESYQPANKVASNVNKIKEVYA